ncbi:hypothetical protein D3C84_1104230 [compost metagenome]
MDDAQQVQMPPFRIEANERFFSIRVNDLAAQIAPERMLRPLPETGYKAGRIIPLTFIL